ncbi:MAG: endonuclease/exonuclease/phosphatase family protein [Phycisphaerae bacterium]|nr:endonuclease/exonuclease/phosphatase family protein [Phycisphaerae bacterium]
MKRQSIRIYRYWTCALTVAWGISVDGVVADPPSFMQKAAPEHVRILCYNINWDSIFPDDDPDNDPYREYNMVAEFRRVVTAVNPDIVCLQEINWDRDPQDVADILDEELPLEGGETWRAHNGSDNVIAARWDLLMLATDTIPTTNRSQAMALVDLPDDAYRFDLYLMNAHFKAGGDTTNINRRKQHAAAIIHWIGDIKTPGGEVDLPTDTPIVVLGDLNVYDTDPHEHLATLVTGDIDPLYEDTYGPDLSPDWDDTDNTDALPLHNGVGPDFYTWRADGGSYNPGALDRVLYTDSALSVGNSYVLNTTSMAADDLDAAGLEFYDVMLNPPGYYDHLPLIVDFVVPAKLRGDWNNDGVVDVLDFAEFPACLSSPSGTSSFTIPPWQCLDVFDFDTDDDIDLADFVAFQRSFEG